MSPNEGPFPATTQTSDRPTRAAVVLTMGMMVLPLVTLVVSAVGCSRSTPHAAAEVHSTESSAIAPVPSAERSSR